MFSGMAASCYEQHYIEKISPFLTRHEKETIAERISGLTLCSRIWDDPDKDYITDFPELKGCVNATLSGLYLCTILKCIVDEFGQAKEQKIKMAKYGNGEFAICPRCGKTTAKNACGYWSCLLGCGFEFRTDKDNNLITKDKVKIGA